MKNHHLIDLHSLASITIVKGKKTKVWDIKQKSYLDFSCGITSPIGHSYYKVICAIRNQMRKLTNIGDFPTLSEIKLANKICNIGIKGSVLFADKKKDLLNSLKKLKNKIIFIDNTSDTNIFSYKPSIVVLSPLTHKGIMSINMAKDIENMCREQDIIFAVDETYTAFGKTGNWFLYQTYKLMPDFIICDTELAGLSISFMVMGKKTEKLIDKNERISFRNNSIGTSYLIGIINAVKKNNLIKNAKKLEKVFTAELKTLKKEVHTLGLFAFIKLQTYSINIKDFLTKGLIVSIVENGKTLFISLPLSITENEIKKGVKIIKEVLDEKDKKYNS